MSWSVSIKAGKEKATLDMDEVTRIDALRRYALLETEPDEVYGGIVRLASSICATPIAAVRVISSDRQWLKCPVGMSPQDDSGEAGFATMTLREAESGDAYSVKVCLVPDTAELKEGSVNPWLCGGARVRFYAGVPLIVAEGVPIGILFVADTKPHTDDAAIEPVLKDLACQFLSLLESRIRAHELDTALTQQRKEEEDLKAQIEQIHSYSRELQVHAVRLEAINARLEALAKLDGMTGLKNHRAFQERLEFEFQRAVRYSMPLSLLLLDVDSFKQFNDTYGHLAGDEVLKTVALVLQENARGVDFVARYGGEEFVVILPHADEAAAFAIGERLRSAIEAVVWPLRNVTASFGIATLTPSMTHANDLIALSDKALYGSKTTGRNRVMHVNDMGVEAK